MKRIERKGKNKMLQIVIAVCMVFNMILAPSSVCYAATPTMDSEFVPLVVGTNDLKVEYYDSSQTMAGCFTTPEKGNYVFYAVNIGELTQNGYLLNEDFAQIDYYSGLDTTKQRTFGTYFCEKGEKIYFYVERFYRNTGTLATRLVIEKEEKKSDVQVNNTPNNPTSTKTPASSTKNNTSVNKNKITISQKSCSLKKGQKIKLKLNNNKKKITWVSREKKIASVNSKGVVKGRKKGTTYIYAIASHKLYKCKVKVN